MALACWFFLVQSLYSQTLEVPATEDLSFTARNDGSLQKYVRVLPASYEKGKIHDVLIALHGHGSDRWQFVRDLRAECQAARDAANEYNLIYLSPDYRARTSWMGPKAEADLIQIIEEVKTSFRVGRIFISGGSMGGTSALTFAALHPDLIDGVIAMNGTANLIEYPNFSEAIQESYGGTRAEIPAEYKARSAEYWPERLTMPLACTTGGQDTLVPPASVIRLTTVLQILERPVLLIHRVDGGHSTNKDDAKAAFKFVIETARKAVKSP